MTFYIKWLTDEPKYIVCSYLAYDKLGSELFGYLLMVPDRFCPDHQMYAIGDILQCPVTFRN